SALRALELDPESAEALASLAFIQSMYNWRWREADDLYRRAIAVNPNNAKARHWYATDHLALLGRFQEALGEIQTAGMLDPLSMIIHSSLAYVYLFRRDYALALTSIERSLDLDPTFLKAYASMGRIHSLEGRYDKAIECFERAWPQDGANPSLISAL